jgi:hypothetical protein
MAPERTSLSRRQVLGAVVLAGCAARLSGDPSPTPSHSIMSVSIRSAASSDLPGIVELLVQDALERSSLDPFLWRSAPDAAARVERAVGPILEGASASPREQWLVAERSGRIVGVMHMMVLRPPPILDPPGDAGLLLDDCYISVDEPPDTADGLLRAGETGLRAAGATALIASCPAAGRLRPLYERHGYESVTLYMAKHGFTPAAFPSSVRTAMSEDVPEIVELSAAHRRTLEKLNPRFWHIHPEADGRFDKWMHRSLTLADRDMLVAAPASKVRGYAIAQPCSPFHLPSAHEIAKLGFVDDFYDEDFADVSTVSNRGAVAAALLAAAEGTFARRGVDSALVVCPAAWSSKITLLERERYRTAKLWMLRR